MANTYEQLAQFLQYAANGSGSIAQLDKEIAALTEARAKARATLTENLDVIEGLLTEIGEVNDD